MGKTWTYRGHELKKLEWGLWKALDEPKRYLLCYRPRGGRNGPVTRQWMYTGAKLTLQMLRQHVRNAYAEAQLARFDRLEPSKAENSLNDYLAELRRCGRSDKHVSDAALAGTGLIEHAGVKFIDRLGVRHVEQFLQHLHGLGRSPRTLNKKRALLSGWFAWAERRDQVARNPVSRTSPVKVVVAYKAFPSLEQMQALVDQSSPHDAGLWCLLTFTGLRRGSFLSLTPESFRPDGILVPHTKRGREWMLRYDDGCPFWAADLTRLGQHMWKTRQPTRTYVRTRFKTACADLGHEYTLHSLRHAFCSWLAMMGESLQDVAAWADHSTAQTTEQWYAHLRPRGRDRADSNREVALAVRSHCMDRALLNAP